MKIKIFLSDVDGVLTDGGMYYTENGDEFKKFSCYDGMGMKLLQKKGFKVGILTSEDRLINRNRAEKLSLDYDFHGIENKFQFNNFYEFSLHHFLQHLNVFDLLLIAFVGQAAIPTFDKSSKQFISSPI